MGMMFVKTYVPFTVACITILLYHHQASGHGFLASPRSRNLHAYEQTKWTQQTSNDPEPETCPQCLNIGGRLARCGIASGRPKRNYDAPRNALGGTMESTVQATYVQGQDVIFDVSLTAHHAGHFVFSACPIKEGEIPSQNCFDKHVLTFVEDLTHGAIRDPNHPERAYIAPVNHPRRGRAPTTSYGPMLAVADYSFKMRLPKDLYGNLVLVQWYYLTANSCIHEGYLEYDWPWDYGWNAAGSGGSSPDMCRKVSNDGSGTPEQFWNCAEVKIERSSHASSSACGSKCNGKESSKSRDKKKPGNKSGKKKLAKKSGKTKVAKKSGKKNGRRKKKRRRRPDRKSKHHVRDRIGPRYKGSKDETM